MHTTDTSQSSPSPSHMTIADAIRSDLVNYEVALRQASDHLQELEVTLDALEREEQLDVNMWAREEARSHADERAVAARLRRASDFLHDIEQRLAEVSRSFPQPEDYARDVHEMEAEIASLAQTEMDTMQELTKASTLLAVLQTRRNEARSDELRALDRLRAEAEALAGQVYQRPVARFGFVRRAPPVGDRLHTSQAPGEVPYEYLPATPSTVEGATLPRRPPQPPSSPSPTFAARRWGSTAPPPLLGPWQAAQVRTVLSQPDAEGLARLQELLAQDRTLVERVDERGNTILHLACGAAAPSVAVLDELVRAGAPLRSFNKDGLTPFHLACLNSGDDATHEAKRYLLSRAGYSVDEPTSSGETAAHLLAQSDVHVPTMEFLIRAGCNLFARANIAGRWCTPGDVAQLQGTATAGRMQRLLRVPTF